MWTWFSDASVQLFPLFTCQSIHSTLHSCVVQIHKHTCTFSVPVYMVLFWRVLAATVSWKCKSWLEGTILPVPPFLYYFLYSSSLTLACHRHFGFSTSICTRPAPETDRRLSLVFGVLGQSQAFPKLGKHPLRGFTPSTLCWHFYWSWSKSLWGKKWHFWKVFFIIMYKDKHDVFH